MKSKNESIAPIRREDESMLSSSSSLQESMKEEFNSRIHQLKRITAHGPSLGRFTELIILHILSKYFPLSIGFSSGFIKGNSLTTPSSSQIDIICFDRLSYPILFDAGELKVIPAKGVKGIIEVKSTLNKSAIDSLLRLSQLPALAEVPLSSKLYILTTRSKLSPASAFKALCRFYDTKPPINKFISVVFSLDWEKIIISEVQSQNADPCSHGNKIDYNLLLLEPVDRGDIACFFAFLLGDLLGVKALSSIANNLGPSLFKIRDKYAVKLGTRTIK